MSRKGIKLAAKALSCLQETRGELLRGDKQDIFLGQLLDDAKDAIKDRFARAVANIPENDDPDDG